jgi:hypothetical protein
VPVIPFLFLAVIAKEETRKREEIRENKEEDKANKQQFFTSVNLPKFSSSKFANLPFNNFRLPQLRLGVQLPRIMITWSLIIFLFLGEYKDFYRYLNRLDTWQATREAVAQVQPQSSILTDNRLAPHFAHRPIVKLLSQISPQTNLAEFQYILLNLRHPWPDTEKIGDTLANQLKNSPDFHLNYQKN